jgi:hypothetical protein
MAMLQTRSPTSCINKTASSSLSKTTKGVRTTVYGIGSPESGFILLPEVPRRPLMTDSQVYWRRINKSGLVIGIKSLTNSKYDGVYPALMTWSPSQGLKQYNFDSAINSPYYFTGENFLHDPMKIAQCENSNNIVLTCKDRIFTLQADRLVEITDVLKSDFEKSGVLYHELKLEAFAVNNLGTIFGKVDCYNKHPYKNVLLKACQKVFIWNNGSAKFHDIPEQIVFDSYSLYLNNKNQVTFKYGNQSFKWDKDADTPDILNGDIVAILDDGTIVWRKEGSSGLLFENDEVVDVKFEDINKPSGQIINIDYFNIERPNISLFFPVTGNHKRICLYGVFYNENHPFILIPQKD